MAEIYNSNSSRRAFLGASWAGVSGTNALNNNSGELGTDAHGVIGIANGTDSVGVYGQYAPNGNQGHLGTSWAGVSGHSGDGTYWGHLGTSFCGVEAGGSCGTWVQLASHESDSGTNYAGLFGGNVKVHGIIEANNISETCPFGKHAQAFFRG